MPESLQSERMANVLERLRSSGGIVTYGELLVEIPMFTQLLSQHHPTIELSRIADITLQAREFSDTLQQPTVDAVLGNTKKSNLARLVRLIALEQSQRGEVPLAGDVLNVARYIETLQAILARSSHVRHRFETVLAGPIGTQDPLGKQAIELLQRETSTVPRFTRVPDGEIGIYSIEPTDGGQGNVPHYDRAGSAARDFLGDPAIRGQILAEARRRGVFFTSMIAVGMTRSVDDILSLLRDVRDAGVLVVIDTNFRSFVMEQCFREANDMTSQEIFEKVIALADLLLAGREDLRKFMSNETGTPEDTPEEMRRFFATLQQRTSAAIVIKADREGAYWLDAKGKMHSLAPRLAEAQRIDTTGAGDSFNAAILIALRQGMSIDQSVAFANDVASCVIQRHGAYLGEPALHELIAAHHVTLGGSEPTQVINDARHRYFESLFGMKGQVAVVIGGTGVLGGALSEGLAAAGATVIIAGRSRDRGQKRAQGIRLRQQEAEFFPVDVCSRESIVALRDAVLNAHGRVDMLVNCAGVNSAAAFEAVTDSDWDRVMDTNLRATYWACQIFTPHMASQEHGGSVLNIGSVTADKPLSKVFAYSASKAAVVNLTQNLAREYATKEVRFNTLCPGFFPAEQNRELLKSGGREQSIKSQTPMGRYGEPDELVGAALLLLSRKAGSFITGTELYVDGGFTGMRF